MKLDISDPAQVTLHRYRMALHRVHMAINELHIASGSFCGADKESPTFIGANRAIGDALKSLEEARDFLVGKLE